MTRWIKRNTWLFVLIFSLLLFPQSISAQTKLDSRALIAGIAIDEAPGGNGYEVTALITMPSSGGGDGPSSPELDFITTEGKSVNDGLSKIAERIGKELSLAHLNYLIIGETLLDQDIASFLDFVLRHSYVDSNIAVLITEGSAKDEIRKTKDLDAGSAISLRGIALSQTSNSSGAFIIARNFVNDSLDPSSSSAVPFLSIYKEPDSESSEGSGGSSSEGGGEEESGILSKQQGRIQDHNKIGIFRDRKLAGKLETDEEILGFLLAYPEGSELRIAFENISNDILTDATLSLRCRKKSAESQIAIKDGIPELKIDISLSGVQLLGVMNNGGKDTTPLYINQKNYLTKDVSEQIASQAEEWVKTAFEKIKSIKADPFLAATSLYRHNPKAFREYFKTHTLDDFIANMTLTVKVEVGIEQS